jgi:fructose-1,6-bisphosphatase/inositol monophosphatase family enzyme
MELESTLLSGARMLRDLKGGERETKSGAGYGDLTNDTDIAADRQLGRYYLDTFLLCIQDLATIHVEGLTPMQKNGKRFHVVCDPLDGSLNYKTRGRSLGLPYSGCAAIFEQEDPSRITYGDLRAAALVDYRPHPQENVSFDSWSAWKTEGGFTTARNHTPFHSLKETVLDLGRMIVIGEFYYPENREKLCRAFAGKKGWLRNPGSAAYEMGLVANGTAAAYICDRQKQHELPTGVALVLGAGGVAVDFEGKSLLDAPFDFNKQQSTILAANQAIADQILTVLHRA